MKIFPKKDNLQRSEDELRLQPFTLLSAMLMAIFVAAAITYTCVYSGDNPGLVRNGVLSALLAAPAIILFLVLWRKEAKRPLPAQARRVAWKFMLGAYVVAYLCALLVAMFAKAPWTSRLQMILVMGMGLPFGFILFRLITTTKPSSKPPISRSVGRTLK